jgi:hypothetical protein
MRTLCTAVSRHTWTRWPRSIFGWRRRSRFEDAPGDGRAGWRRNQPRAALCRRIRGACFESATRGVARKQKKSLPDANVTGH